MELSFVGGMVKMRILPQVNRVSRDASGSLVRDTGDPSVMAVGYIDEYFADVEVLNKSWDCIGHLALRGEDIHRGLGFSDKGWIVAAASDEALALSLTGSVVRFHLSGYYYQTVVASEGFWVVADAMVAFFEFESATWQSATTTDQVMGCEPLDGGLLITLFDGQKVAFARSDLR